jgi:hypothetical protein
VYKADLEPFIIKGLAVQPRNNIKVLGVIIDTKLKYKEHIVRASSKGLEAVIELRQLRGLLPLIVQQLFTSTIALVVDYTSNIWIHKAKYKAVQAINRVQRIGTQAIVGTFNTIATNIAKAEAHIVTAQDRFWKRVIKFWTDIYTLPETNLLHNTISQIQQLRRYCSPLYQVANVLKDVSIDSLKTINPFILAL